MSKLAQFASIRCYNLKVKCIKSDFDWGSAVDPNGGAYSALPDHAAGYGEGRGRGGKQGKEVGKDGIPGLLPLPKI